MNNVKRKISYEFLANNSFAQCSLRDMTFTTLRITLIRLFFSAETKTMSFNVVTYQTDFASMDRAVRVAILVCFGYLLVMVVDLDAFERFADASYFAGLVQQAAHYPFVCTFPCADFDEPEIGIDGNVIKYKKIRVF